MTHLFVTPPRKYAGVHSVGGGTPLHRWRDAP